MIKREPTRGQEKIRKLLEHGRNSEPKMRFKVIKKSEPKRRETEDEK